MEISEEHVASFIRVEGKYSSACYFIYDLLFKMEETCSSEMSVDFQRTTWRYVPESLIEVCNFCTSLEAH
jgi:hypothetical protein